MPLLYRLNGVTNPYTMGLTIGIHKGLIINGSKGSSRNWTALNYILSSGVNKYKREINKAGGYFVLYYSSNSGITWDTLLTLDLTESSVIIDLPHIYRHRTVGTSYHVDQKLTPIGYSGIENIDWENIYST